MIFSRVLYFVALVPSNEVKEEVLHLKQDIRSRFGASHALKLPAHITIIPPFHLEDEKEQDVIKKLEVMSSAQAGFIVKLRNFGHFGQRVIFIEVENPQPVREIHATAKKKLPYCFSKPSDFSIHPHITLATRDLSKEQFKMAWNEFKTRPYSGSFEANGLFLFKHNGKSWDLHKEFRFGEGQGQENSFP